MLFFVRGSTCIDILRATKALVVSEPIVALQNLAECLSTKFYCSFPPFSTCTAICRQYACNMRQSKAIYGNLLYQLSDTFIFIYLSLLKIPCCSMVVRLLDNWYGRLLQIAPDCRILQAYCRHIAVQVENGGKLRQNLVDRHSAKFCQATIGSLTTRALAVLKISVRALPLTLIKYSINPYLQIN